MCFVPLSGMLFDLNRIYFHIYHGIKAENTCGLREVHSNKHENDCIIKIYALQLHVYKCSQKFVNLA